MSRAPIPRRILWSLVVSYVVSIALGVNALLYANHVDNQSNHNWCEVIDPLNIAYTQAPPQTELGRQIAIAFRHLKDEFGC